MPLILIRNESDPENSARAVLVDDGSTFAVLGDTDLADSLRSRVKKSKAKNLLSTLSRDLPAGLVTDEREFNGSVESVAPLILSNFFPESDSA